MANLNIAIKIAANDEASGPLGKINQSLGNLKTQGLAGLQTAGALATGALVAGSALAVTAVGAIGVAAFGVADDVRTATSNIQAQLGLTAVEAEELGDVATNVWKNNFAGSIVEAGNAVALVRQQLGDLADDELQDATESAFALQDVFGVQTPESISAAATLMQDFGLTSEQAFDFITAGFQQGLDKSGDFLDTIGEYSTQFANGGADAGQFFSLLNSGLQGGMLGTDKAADAFKEFRVRIQDGSDLTAESLEMIGIDSERLFAQMSDGTVTAADAFIRVQNALRAVDDQNLVMQAGVGLLGTQFEDLGTEAALSLSLVGTELGDLAGSTDTLAAKYNTMGSMFEGFKRQGLAALQPIGEVLLSIGNSAMPLVNAGFAWFTANVVPAIERGASFVQRFADALTEGQGPVGALQSALMQTFGGEVANQVMAIVTGMQRLFGQIQTALTPVIEFVTRFVSWRDVMAAIGVVIASVVLPALFSIVTAVAPVIGAALALVAIISLVRNAWENDWGGIRTHVENTIAFVVPLVMRAIENIKNWWQNNGQAIMNGVERVWGFISNTIGDYLDVVKIIWKTFSALFRGDFEGFGAGLVEIWQSAWTLIRNFMSGLWTLLQPVLAALWQSIRTWWGNIDWAQLGSNIITGIVAGLQATGRAVWDFLRGLVNAAVNGILGFMGGGYVSLPANPPGFAAGGYTGNVSASQIAGVVHGGEYVFSAQATRNMGVGTLDMLHQAARQGGGMGGAGMTTINVDARGSQMSAAEFERVIRRVLAEQGREADTRRRT